MNLLALGLAAAVMLALPATAPASDAGVATICTGEHQDQCRGPLVAIGGDGVDLVVERRGDELSVRDRAGELTARDGCRQAGPQEALCPVLAALPEVRTGERDDTITLVGQRADVHAGAGRDTIAGSDGGDVLDGGSGPDVIDGRGGADRIVTGHGADRVSAGTGDDVVLADGRTCPQPRDEAERESCGPPDVDGDVIACGTGSDRLERARPIDDASGCERAILLGRRVRVARLRSGALAVSALRGCECRTIAAAVRAQSTAAGATGRAGRTLVLRPKRRWPRWANVYVRLDGHSAGGLVMKLR